LNSWRERVPVAIKTFARHTKLAITNELELPSACRWATLVERKKGKITQFYLQITPCLPFLRECSPDVTTTATEAADIQLQLTTHLSTLKG